MVLTEPVVKNADMSDEMIQFAKDSAVQGLEEFKREVDVAEFIRKKFDETYGPTWSCVVGRQFGSDVTHESKKYINLSVGQLSFLIWKSG